jgi:hypothetical protein
VVIGTASLPALRRALAATVDLVHARKSRLSLTNAALIAAPKGSALLVVDSTQSLPRSLNVLSSGGAVWTKEGLTATYGDSVSVISSSSLSAADQSPNPYDLVERLSDGRVRVSQRVTSARSAYGLTPSAVVLLVNDSTKALPAVTRLAASTAVSLASSPLVGMPSSQKEALKSQLGQNTSVFAVNAALLGSDGDVTAVINSIADGSAQSATLSPLKEIEAGAITKIKGVDDAKLSPSKVDKVALQTLAKTLASPSSASGVK